MINFNELDRRVRKKLGNLFSSSAHDESSIYDYVNDAMERLSKDGFWDFNNRICTVNTTLAATEYEISEFTGIYGILKN